MTPPTTSVVVSTVDRPGSLARCLDAIRRGSRLPDEVVVVDQGGLDATAAAIAGVTSLAVAHVRSERGGLSAARNLGLRRASGDVVAFTDDDVAPDPGWLEALVRSLVADSALDAVTGPMLPLGDPEPGRVAVSSRLDAAACEFGSPIRPWAVGTGGNMAFRRERLERIGGYDERLGVGSPGRAGEDLDVVRRILATGGRIRYEPAAVCRHERKTLQERRETRSRYGYGAGASLGRWLRDGDARALVSLAAWLSLRTRMAVRAGTWTAVADELRVVAGTLAGLGYGIRLPRWERDLRRDLAA